MAPDSPLAMFTSADGKTRLQIRLQDDSLWLTQKQIADLFERSNKTISEHINNIYGEGELEPDATIRKFRTVALEGTREVERLLDHYNLDAVFSVGYRVRSVRGTQFRKWANQVLTEYLIKGFAMDDERLKNPDKDISTDYFDELLERIRDIRASERRFYQKITDIYATASDYNKGAPVSHSFFATVQNKLHWAIHGHTAAELVQERAHSELPNMGLTSWKGKQVTKKDVSVAKNYLSPDELKGLNRVVTMYLDFAELQAERKQSMTMKQWATKLDAFLEFNEHNILTNSGKISHKIAQQLAEQEYEKFVDIRRVELKNVVSDFDELISKTKLINKKK
ncbi:MAG: hydroxyacid dehydrogenase [Oceanobacter sp.]|nr:MAG: hydroxyacid dehydrogenase [Oceanobacter sp.]